MFTGPIRNILASTRGSSASGEREDGARLIRGFRLPTGGQMLGLGVGAAALGGVALYATNEVLEYRHHALASAIYESHGMPALAAGSSVRGFSESRVPGSHAVSFKIRYADGSEHKEPLVRRQNDVDAFRALQLNNVHVPATAAKIVIGEKSVTYMIGTSPQTQELPDGFDADKKSKLERAGARLDQARGQLGEKGAQWSARASDSAEAARDRLDGAKAKLKGWFRKDEQ